MDIGKMRPLEYKMSVNCKATHAHSVFRTSPARIERMNPPYKVGARSLLPGFRINGYESPFHRQCGAPFDFASVHRNKGWSGTHPQV